MKYLFSLIIFLATTVYANEITSWSGSGTSLRSENGQTWEKLQCDNTLGMETQISTNADFLIITGGLCYRLDIGVGLKIVSGNLILTKNSFGFSAPWESDDIGKVVGKLNGKSFNYSFTIIAPDTKTKFIIQGNMDILNDSTANVTFSNDTVLVNGQKYKVQVSGVLKHL